MSLPRPEYPRPQFERAEWLNLNGQWAFQFDDENAGLRDCWHDAPRFSNQITVPFAFQSPLSGIHDRTFHDVVWYHRTVEIPGAWAGKRVLLHFGAVDYRAWVWVNGRLAVIHEGGHTPFQADITDLLEASGEQSIVVRAEDSSTDLAQPRGKQYWEVESKAIFYTRTSGIWQTVWLEPVGETHLGNIRITPDVDRELAEIAYTLNGPADGVTLRTEISLGDELLYEREHGPEAQSYPFAPGKLHLWSPEHPTLYTLTMHVCRGSETLDTVTSYFGMRKISVDGGVVKLNNEPYTMRLVLDQGYHPDGLLTYPSDEAIRRDIELTKAMGFNGVRKHQKVEEPRYLYWADFMGLLAWGEMANGYLFNDQSVRQHMQEWQEAVQRDYNHPCIVAWVPVNESWGVPDIPRDPRQTEWLRALYHLTKTLDPTRLAVSNDGWEHAKSDLLTIHDYTGDYDALKMRYADIQSALEWRPGGHALYTPGTQYADEPVLVTEFGGIAYRVGMQEGWGYTSASDSDAFIAQVKAVFDALHESPLVQGYCYTQLTDVEQEINGVLTYDRQPKVDPEIIRRINLGLSLET